MFSQMYGQVEVVSSEYVGDEFHFRLRIPMPETAGDTTSARTGTSGDARTTREHG